jgi:DNA-binding transcriptional ArsR family regulator
MKIRRTYKKLSPEQVEEIKVAASQGASIRELSRRFEVSMDTVSRHIPKKQKSEIVAEADAVFEPSKSKQDEFYRDHLHFSVILAEQEQRRNRLMQIQKEARLAAQKRD